MISQNGTAIICQVSKNTGNTGHFLKNSGIYRTIKKNTGNTVRTTYVLQSYYKFTAPSVEGMFENVYMLYLFFLSHIHVQTIKLQNYIVFANYKAQSLGKLRNAYR